MQFKLASAVPLLAAVSPAFASTLSTQLQELSASTVETRQNFEDISIVQAFQQGPVSNVKIETVRQSDLLITSKESNSILPAVRHQVQDGRHPKCPFVGYQ